MPKSKTLNFEQALERLEQIVQHFESEKIDLNASMTLFEEGVQLTRQCQKQLSETRKRIDVYLKETDTLDPYQSPE